jgi:tetratricopeptide (TPR) repeat protein
MNKTLFIFLSILTITSYSWSSTQDNCAPSFQKAVAFYENQKYSSAIEQFNRCIDKGVVNADLHHNIGNAHYRLDHIALAILHFEKSLKLDPMHKDALHNLKLAESKKVDKQSNPHLEGFIFKTLYYLPLNQSIQIATLLFFIWISLVLFSRGRKERAQLRLYAMAVFTFILLTPIALSSTYRAYRLQNTSAAIILSETVQVLTGPSQKSKLLSTLHTGAKVKILEERKTWVKIELEDNQGWLMNKDLGKI